MVNITGIVIINGRKIVRMSKKVMRRILVIIITIAFNLSCSNGKVDERKLDAAGDKLQESVEKVVDTAESKIDKLKDNLDKKE